MNKIEKFIKDNDLSFDSEGSGLNSNCTILSGFALHLGLPLDELSDLLRNSVIPPTAWDEFERVYNYAEANNYGVYWSGADAKDRYIF